MSDLLNNVNARTEDYAYMLLPLGAAIASVRFL